ncbi:MAG: DUF1801 domain-containing protein [Bacteroidetes bacterium]|nr:DUF1801 domain-containing protein [Bacteroidota bacterium]
MENPEKIKFKSVDEYIASFPANFSEKLECIRKIVNRDAPAATEVISYNMPAYKYKGMLLYFAAHSSHIGFYAMKSANVIFKEDLKGYKTTIGGIQFPVDKDIPVELVSKIVRYRIAENDEKEMLKKQTKQQKR